MEPTAAHGLAVAESKKPLRAEFKALRRDHALDDSASRRRNQALQRQVLDLCPPRNGLCVFTFLALPEECDTAALIDAYAEAGAHILVPVIEGRSPMQACLFPGWHALVPGVLGIRSPREPAPWEGPVELALVPGLAFTVGGDRLGYGGGYYDRWLAQHPETLRAGVCFDFQITDHLPVQPHDTAMDLVVCDAGAHWTHRRPGFTPRLPPSC